MANEVDYSKRSRRLEMKAELLKTVTITTLLMGIVVIAVAAWAPMRSETDQYTGSDCQDSTLSNKNMKR